MTTYTRTKCLAGDVGNGFPLYDAAWCECIELQCSDRHGWVEHTMRCIADANRVEICAYIDDALIGGIVLHAEYDPHVGHCMYIVFQYVKPEYRNRGTALNLFKLALEETRLQGLPVLAYTHRLGDWEYKTTYRKV